MFMNELKDLAGIGIPYGGCVRNALNSETILDFHLIVESKSLRYLGRFLGKRPEPMEAGLLKSIWGGKPVYIRTVKKLNEKNVRMVLEKQPFTVNMAALMNGEIFSIHSALDDIRNRVLKVHGDPDRLFKKEPILILKAIRLIGMGYRPEERLSKSIKRNVHMLSSAKPEFIGEEVFKAACRKFSGFIEGLVKYKAYRYVFPEIGDMLETRHSPESRHKGKTVYEHSLEVLKRLEAKGASPTIKIAGFFHDVGKPYVKEVVDGEVRFPRHAGYGARIMSKRLSELGIRRGIVRDVFRLILLHQTFHAIIFRPEPDPRKIFMSMVKKFKAGRLIDDLVMLCAADADIGEETYRNLAEEIKRELNMSRWRKHRILA